MLYPMAAMVLLTFLIGIITVSTRFASVKRGDINPGYFKLMQGEGESVPEFVAKTTRCFNNQFEIPVLFYVVATLYLSLGIESLIGVIFAGLFVVFRCVHAYIHLTYNHIIHRLTFFWLAFLSVIVLWANLVVNTI